MLQKPNLERAKQRALDDFTKKGISWNCVNTNAFNDFISDVLTRAYASGSCQKEIYDLLTDNFTDQELSDLNNFNAS